MKKKITPILILLLIAGSIFFSAQLKAAPEINQAAINYLKTKDDSAWKTMALVAAGEAGLSGEHLKNVSSENAIDYCAPTLAITALGKDPRIYPSQDYVAKLKSFWDGTQLGNASTLNDDIFGLLALISSGELTSDSVVIGIKNYLIAQQNINNGWGFAAGGDSDTNMTAMAIMALLEAGLTRSDTVITNAVTYLQSSQNDDGGFPYDPKSPWGTDSDASSDAWVISAIYALGQEPETWTKNGHHPVEHLKSLQTPTGYFEYQEGTGEDAFTPVTTAYAVIALAGKAYPVGKITYTPTEKFSLRIEGQSSTICRGQFTGPTALDVVKNAADTCGFTYVIEETAYGPYLRKINNDEATGLTGWLYLVNNIAPSVGAADYILETGEEVLWYFGEWGWKPLKLKLSQFQASSSESVEATVTYYDNEWQALEAAVVKAGSQEFTTNVSGKANLSLPDGYYQVQADKEGYIRSNGVSLRVGATESIDIGLKVNIISEEPGTPPGGGPPAEETEISFSVDLENVDFGDLAQGQSKTQNVNLTNNGAVNLHFESEVSGASVFQDNLFISQKHWPDFELDLGQSTSSNLELGLSIPISYSEGTGEKRGTLTFWAMELR